MIEKFGNIGRMKTKQLHATAETLTYDYNVRSWLTQVSGTKFNQTLAYNAPVNGITPTKELYNGNISAMKWKAGGEASERGYQFTYDGVNRLTNAIYGEGATITANPNRFNEKMTYDKMGNITTLQRQGKLNSGYGLMDNLTYDYSGNQLTKVTDAATPAITYPGAFHFVDGANTTNEYTYDANGNLTKDLNKNITQITYNVLNLPKVVTFSNANTITYTYDASGNKLSVAYTAGGTTVKTDYVGNKVYKNGTLSMMHTEEGYITFSGTTPTYHYYLKDHQGNNRVVMNQNGTVEQVNHYYPFGGLFGEGLQTSNQPYKYNGKELDRFEGLDIYDYGARYYDAARGGWGTVDPHAEKYYSWSPYVYVYNNPITYIDPDGRDGRVTGSGKKDDPYIITANYYYKDGSLDKGQLKGVSKAIDTYNNKGKAWEIKNDDGSKTYVAFNLSVKGVEDVGKAVTGDIFTQDAVGQDVSFGNALGTEPNPSGDGDEFGSANGWRVDVNIDNIVKGVETQGYNQTDLLKGTYIHEIGHNLGLDHHDKTNIMIQAGATIINSQIGASKTITSYPSLDKRGIKILMNNVNRPRVGRLGIIRTQ